MTPTARALLAAARAGLDPDPSAAARIRAKLDARLAAPAAGLSLKLLATLGIVGGIATLAALSTPAAARATVPAAPAMVEVAPAETPVRVVAASAESSVPPRAVDDARAHRVHVAAAPRDISLAREVELIDRAMSALRAGHADDALTAITLYHRETADRGQLLEDASAIDIEASCTLHLDVSTKLAAFDATWPSSAQRARRTNACH